jgi:hypothetical protein
MTSAPFYDNRDQAISRLRWPLERVLFALAGSMTLLSAALSALVSPWFLLLTALVGVNQWLFVLFGACPASLILRRVFSLSSVLYPQESPVRSGERGGSCSPSASSPSGGSPATRWPISQAPD